MASHAAVLFDLDQTLIDSRECSLRSFEHAFRQEVGVLPSRERILQLWGLPLERQMAEMAGPTVAGRLFEAYREFQVTQDHLITLYPEWPTVLAELRRRGFRLAVVTAKKRDRAMHHLTLVGIEDLFDTVVGADDTLQHKPDPEPFLHAAERLRIPPTACIAIGDTPGDIIGAKRAGMTAALAEWDFLATGVRPPVTSDPDAEPDIRLGSPTDILRYCLVSTAQPQT